MEHRYFIKIEKNDNGKYQAQIHHNQASAPHICENLFLSPTDTVKIKGTSYPLRDVIQGLIQHDSKTLSIAYDERGQLEIGQHLYRQIFENAPPEITRPLQNDSHKTEIRIITSDEHISRLPWVLLATPEACFLSSLNCTVSLAGSTDCKAFYLPPSPRILIAAPQPHNVDATKAESHLKELENMLSSADHRFYRGRHLQIALTWEEFQQQAEEFNPHIVYCYGHGVTNGHTSRLLFASGKNRKLSEVSFADVADCLRNGPDCPPILAYFNCCQGDAGGLLGAGIQLRNFIPAVITNRTEAKIPAAQAQALVFWRCALLDGLPPHEAMNAICHHPGRLNLSLSDARWMTPVIHCGYSQWKTNPPEPVSRHIHDPHWHVKLDRVSQFSKVYYLTTQMLREQRPRSLAYLWYGAEGQGIDLFHERLKVELREKLSDAVLCEILPVWPIEVTSPNRSFEDMMTEAFDVQTMDHIPGRIREYTGGRSGKNPLVYIRHRPLRTTKVITLKVLSAYLEWWDSRFAPLLKGQAFGLLGISFVVGNPEKFHDILVNKRRIEELTLHDTSFHLLDEMDKLVRQDLLDFLKTHNIRLPYRLQDKVLEEIFDETDGQYEMTLEALKDLVNRAWDLYDDQADAGEDDDDEDFGVDD